ncbi:phenylalanyl-tRNA synthetase subunit beta [Petrotoga miotherma DSM 10691]|uniref:Phenylalanine--tRNA ligase beta subunit n=3 Tax=Petrotoga TaxID=28236 RepID=A0A2K1PA76_9BACT|nr:phenylalanine--tRNA ligase subunit beta [Petrotoga miotherma]PNR99692.1 phenylalanyl-tRNA synthetase subunit beta [Petrotoga miotherma DSM 10691]
MKVSLNWLEEYIKVTKNIEELVKEIKLHSVDVEGFEKMGNDLNNITVGEIKEITPLENADNLVICKIDVGKEIKNIVTGDLTVKVGEKVPVALPGATLANNIKIEEREFKGVISQGMMCSLKELGISSDADKIYRIIDDVPNGTDFVKFFDLYDHVLEIEILPNRPDLLSYLGVAKELETIDCGVGFKLPEYIKISKGEGFPVRIEYEKCNRYMATVVKDVKVGPSPMWLVKRLGRSGIRSINNIVDITNYVMLETGHPIHAFDLDLIGDQIIVRKAKKGEKILLLDGKEYTMEGAETLITDGDNIIALGGIMGGELSGINENTKDILLEVAHFDPVNIRRSSTYHKITSDSSYRFERGVDPNNSEMVMGRLIKLINELTGGKVDGPTTDIYPEPIKNKEISIKKSYINNRLGKELAEKEIEQILKKLDFPFTKVEKSSHQKEMEDVNKKTNLSFDTIDEEWKVSIPTKRPDITQEIDLVEEVGRVYGYSKIQSAFPNLNGMIGSKGDFVSFKEKVADIMLANGYHEAKTFPLNNGNRMWMENELDLKLINPISSELEYMSSKLIYGLLDSASFNYRNQIKDIKMFEIDKVFQAEKGSETGAKEFTNLAFVATGRENNDDFTDKREVTFYSVKGALENLLNEFHVKVEYVRNDQSGFLKAQSALLFINSEEVGFLGLLDPVIADNYYEIKDPIYICEINLNKIFEGKKEIKREFRKVDLPAIKREYSMIVPLNIEFKEIQEIIINVADIVEDFKIFDVYRGKNIEEDKTSITVSIVYRSENKTLTEEEVNQVERSILESLNNKGIKLRES